MPTTCQSCSLFLWVDLTIDQKSALDLHHNSVTWWKYLVTRNNTEFIMCTGVYLLLLAFIIKSQFGVERAEYKWTWRFEFSREYRHAGIWFAKLMFGFLKALRCCFCNPSLNLRLWWTERALYHKPGMLTVQTARYVNCRSKLCGNSSLSHKSRWMVRYHSMMLPMVYYYLSPVIWLDNAFNNICVNSFCDLPATKCWYLFD